MDAMDVLLRVRDYILEVLDAMLIDLHFEMRSDPNKLHDAWLHLEVLEDRPPFLP